MCLYLRQGPPVHVGTADVNVLLVYNPELGVKDARRERSHVNCPDIGSWNKPKQNMSYCLNAKNDSFTRFDLEKLRICEICESKTRWQQQSSPELTVKHILSQRCDAV